MKKVILFLVFLVFFKSIESAEQPQAPINQESAQVAFYDDTWDGWAYEMFSECWFNMKTGQVSVTDPRNNTLNAPKASTR
ncbi:MAG: hypothetical protein LVQ75_04310 [Candidatus Babeliales bacterium]|jgi:hypothetical protein